MLDFEVSGILCVFRVLLGHTLLLDDLGGQIHSKNIIIHSFYNLQFVSFCLKHRFDHKFVC